MSRSGFYDDDSDYDQLAAGRWNGQLASAIRGRRGQGFLKDLLDSLDAMPEKRLIADDLVREGEFCTIGVLGAKRGVDLAVIDPYDHDKLASTFDIAPQLVRQVEWENDEGGYRETPEARWKRMREWVASQINVTES
jgi:hypothetical protein